MTWYFLRLWPPPVGCGQKVMSFFWLKLWCPKIIIWFCHHMVIILTMTEKEGFHSGAITFERATDGLWLT